MTIYDSGERLLEQTSPTAGVRGWVYVISNKSMPAIIKVGYSLSDPEERARELNHTGCPHPYLVDYDVLVEDPRSVEKVAHLRLQACNEGKEWFRCSVEEAIASIQLALGNRARTENFRFADRARAEEIRTREETMRVAEREVDRELGLLGERRREICRRYDLALRQKTWLETLVGLSEERQAECEAWIRDRDAELEQVELERNGLLQSAAQRGLTGPALKGPASKCTWCGRPRYWNSLGFAYCDELHR